MPRRKPRTWAELIAARIGLRRGARAIAFAITWAVTESDWGRAPTIEEYAEEWGCSRATAFRDLALFREALPEFDTPSEWYAAVGVADMARKIPPSFQLAT